MPRELSRSGVLGRGLRVDVVPDEEDLEFELLELFLSIARPVLAKGPARARVGMTRTATRKRRLAAFGCMPTSLR